MFVFSFGTLVFVNCASTDVMDVISYFKKLDKNLADFKWVEYRRLQTGCRQRRCGSRRRLR